MGYNVLNYDTLLLVQICITVLTTVLLSMAALYSEGASEQRWWAMGNVVSSVGLALASLDSGPLVLHAVLGYGVLGLGLALVLRGLRLFCNETLSWRWIVAIVAGALLSTGFFTYAEPSLNARLSVTGFYFGLLNVLCAATLARHADWRSVGASVAGFAALGVALCVRGVYLLQHEPGDESALLVLGIVMLTVPLAQVSIAFGLILMVMRRYAERLRNLSWVDSLTGALNRAGLETQGRRVAQRTLRAGRCLAVIMLDADHFKDINDTWGHPVGDAVLRHLTRQIKAELRPLDLLARYGGEEFVLLLDGVNLDDALRVAERLRAKVEGEQVDVAGHTVRYTASMGVVCSDQHGYDLLELIVAGDAAMYAAKRAGRNRVMAG
ncbi:GGDEF domain-containing protein [Duganella sp. FT3S]|uniref:diguanylate cyclase n=1 Tax=Rugamonas fusca TaxID=2758568 RepID=A0A7W2EJ36_9BURK|nr:GGDEF domain-containing protein [Rugamonas fusca]MBA5606670.1 GGDEF domain-containing protein [Rugamonas fusca]